MDHDVRPEEIIYTSFTRAACHEAIQRALSSAAGDGYKKDNFPWFKTEHAICFKLLGLDKEHVFTGKNMQAFSDKFPAYRFTASHGYSFQQRAHETMLQSLGDYYEFFISWMDNMALPFNEAIRKFIKNQRGELPSEFTVSGAQTYMERRDAFKQENSFWDFSDMIHSVTQRRLCPEVKVLIMDEAQDSSRLLWNMINMWAEQTEKVFIGGDKYQCVPAGTQIQTPSGIVPIETLKQGDAVISSAGGGTIATSNIDKVHQYDVDATQVTIETESKKKLRMTANHQIFAFINLYRGDKQVPSEYYYVYLMYKEDIGWRIGVSRWLAARIRTEGNTPMMFILADFDTLDQALYYEALWSLQYGIPTQTFISHQTKGGSRQVIYGEVLRQLCDELNVRERVKVLAKDLEIDLRFPIHIPASFYQRNIPQRAKASKVIRVVANVHMAEVNHNRNRPKGWHSITVETGDPEFQNRIEKVLVWEAKVEEVKCPQCGGASTKKTRGKDVQHYKCKLCNKEFEGPFRDNILPQTGYMRDIKGGRRFRKYSRDFAFIMDIAEKLRRIGVVVKVTHTAKGNGEETFHHAARGLLINAGNLRRGFHVPVLSGEEIKWERITKITKEHKKETVYDLDVESYHNYIAEGIMVHNSIFGFSGADPELFDAFKGELEVLPHSYRLPPQIKDYAEKIIGLANLPFPKFSAADKVGEIKNGQINTIDWLNLGPTFMLARTRWQLKEISERLKLMGVPFALTERLGYQGPLQSSQGDAYHTLIKIQARERVSTDDLRALIKHTRQPWLVKGAKTRIRDLAQAEYSFNEVSHFFSQNFLDVIKEDFSRVLCQDIEESDKSYLHRVYKKCGVNAFLKKPDIILSTIHGSKGQQKETIVISPEMGKRVYEGFLIDKKSEVFVAYVAVTRSMKRIIMLPRETPESFPYPRMNGGTNEEKTS